MITYRIYKHDTSNKWVTFIHGAGGSSETWKKQVEFFKKEFNVLIPDLRGHGETQNPEHWKDEKYTFEIISDDVVEVLQHLGIKKSHFVGISLGSILIRDIHYRFPQLVDKMVLGGAIFRINFIGNILCKGSIFLQKKLSYETLYKVLARVILPRKNHETSRRIFIREAQKIKNQEFDRWFALIHQINGFLKYQSKHPLTDDMLMLMGGQDYIFLKDVIKFIKRNKKGKLSTVENCGHLVNIEKGRDFNKIALDFLK